MSKCIKEYNMNIIKNEEGFDMKNEKMVCPHTNLQLIVQNEIYKVKGEPIEIEAQVNICKDCDAEIFNFEYDTENLKKAYTIYRKHHDLLSTQDIIALRKKYNLSQRAFATLIGCTQATIVRYEKGAIQDQAYNNIMKLMNKPENVAELLDGKRDKLEVKEIKAVEDALEKLNHNERRRDNQILASIKFLAEKDADVFNGFKRFNIEKFKAMVVFFAKKQPSLYKTKLMKLLWYSDMLYFKNYIKSISGARYIHQHFGPIPEEHNLLLGLLESLGCINTQEQETQYGVGEIIVAGQNVDCLRYLSKSEIDTLNIINDKFKNISAADISEISHKEKGYEETKLKNNISFEYAMQLKAL